MLEIGPGIGTMTQYLATGRRKGICGRDRQDADSYFGRYASGISECHHIKRRHSESRYQKTGRGAQRWKTNQSCGESAYYITTPIIMGLFESDVPIASITVMVQKEVADRMQVGPGTKDYGACLWQSSITLIRTLWQMCLQTASCRDRKWEVRSYA